MGRPRREGRPGPPRDQPRRPVRDDRRRGRAHQPRRQDLARGRRRPGHGQDLRLRRRGAAGRHQGEAVHRPRRHRRQRGRRHLHRRLDRPGLARRGAGRAVGRRPLLRGRDRPGRRGRRRHRAQRAPDPDPRRREAAAGRPDQRRHPGGLRPRPAVRRAGHRPVPDRAHVPRRPAAAGREADPGRRTRTSGTPRSTQLEPLQKQDFLEIFEAMDGLPVDVRLLDPPLHEFLPDLTELSVRVALAEERGEPDEGSLRLLAAVQSACTSQNPMLGLRGVRLGLVVPGLFTMQVRAIAEAAARAQEGRRGPAAGDHDPAGRRRAGARGDPRGVRAGARRGRGAGGHRRAGHDRHDDRGAARGADRRGDRRVGRLLLLRHQRPDPDDLGLLPGRRRGGVLPRLPGQGHLRRLAVRVAGLARASAGWSQIAVEAGRAARPDLKLGVCGEHGGDPDSVHFFHEVGLDYVSCSPFRVPVARLEAGRAALGGERSGG